MCGFLQVIAVLAIEIVSIGIICSATDPITIIMNFISLAIVVDFDTFVYRSIKNESFKELI
jgi:riboflavin transporter FmnP